MWHKRHVLQGCVGIGCVWKTKGIGCTCETRRVGYISEIKGVGVVCTCETKSIGIGRTCETKGIGIDCTCETKVLEDDEKVESSKELHYSYYKSSYMHARLGDFYIGIFHYTYEYSRYVLSMLYANTVHKL